MRRNKEDAGLFGIRTTVWLFAFGLVFGCMVITAPRHREPPVPGIAPDEAAAHSGRRIQTSVQVEVRPEVDNEPAVDGAAEIDLSMIEQVVQDRCTWMDPVMTWQHRLTTV